MYKIEETWGSIYLGIDVGGKKVRAGISDGKELLYTIKEPTKKGSMREFLLQLVKISENLCKKAGIQPSELSIACVASFGPMDLSKGELVNPVHLPFERVPLVQTLQKKLKTDVYLINDCVAAAIGEHEFGLGKGVDNMVYINLGAGIGAGIYVDGRVLWGKDGNAHEVGHYTVDPEGKLKCRCGRRGHWEAYCSGPGIEALARHMGMQKSCEQILSLARQGDKRVQRLMEQVHKFNTIGFANVINSYDPELIVVGGAVALAAGQLILDPVRERVKEYAINAVPKIELTVLGEEVGMYGAVAAASQRFLLEFRKGL